jgi:hypothetical protein
MICDDGKCAAHKNNNNCVIYGDQRHSLQADAKAQKLDGKKVAISLKRETCDTTSSAAFERTRLRSQTKAKNERRRRKLICAKSKL